MTKNELEKHMQEISCRCSEIETKLDELSLIPEVSDYKLKKKELKSLRRKLNLFNYEYFKPKPEASER